MSYQGEVRLLEGKTALVTGGASGLGKAIAEGLMADGATVYISDIQLEAGAATADQLGLHFLRHDVCDEDRWSSVVREIEERSGHLDILVNNAGISGSIDAADPETTSLTDWNRVFEVNAGGAFLGCRAALPAMRRAGEGSIVNVSSVAALLATPNSFAYGASKAAVRQITKSIAQHCAMQNLKVRCNSVHPGYVRTPMWDSLAEELAGKRRVAIEEVHADMVARIPMGDWTLPQDVASAVAFLVSPGARHITGTKLIVDGGIVNCDTYPRATPPDQLSSIPR